MNVVYVEQWGKRNDARVVPEAYLRLDRFVRSRIIPPPIGTITFSFKSGKFSMCTMCSRARGTNCEVLIEGDEVTIIGSPYDAGEMIAHIEAEISGIPLLAVASA